VRDDFCVVVFFVGVLAFVRVPSALPSVLVNDWLNGLVLVMSTNEKESLLTAMGEANREKG